MYVKKNLIYVELLRNMLTITPITLVNKKIFFFVTRIIDGVSKVTFHADFKSALTFFLTRQVSE